jgi:predicted transcriptional regulator
MKTTLEMPDELFRRAKTVAAKRGQSLKQLVTTALERELAGPAPGIKSSKRKQAEVEASLRELERITKEISAAWPEGVSAVEAIREQRRDL